MLRKVCDLSCLTLGKTSKSRQLYKHNSVSKNFWPTVKKIVLVIKFETNGQTIFLRSLEQLIQTFKCWNNVWNRMLISLITGTGGSNSI